MTMELSTAQIKIGGVDISGFASTVGVELDPWQVEVLENALEQRPGGLVDWQYTWRVQTRQNGRASGLRELFGPILDEVPGMRASWRRPWSVQTWQDRRKAGLPPQRVVVDQGRVEVLFTVPVTVRL
jgi:hypothetical protein